MFESVYRTRGSRVEKTVNAVLFRFLSCVLGLALASSVGAETLLIGGNGAAGPLIERLCELFGSAVPNVHCHLISPPLGSNGGIKALATGKIDLAVVARPLKTEEKASLGRSFALGDTPFVLATNGGQRRQGLTRDDLVAVYAGRLLTWDTGGPIRLVLRTSDDSDTAELRSMSPAMSEAVVAADKREGMTFASDDMDTLALLERVPGSLGPITLGLLKTTGSPLTPLPLDGVAPTLEHLKDGSYPWRRTLTVVLAQKASPAAEKFADFLRSPRAADLLRRNAYIPAPP